MFFEEINESPAKGLNLSQLTPESETESDADLTDNVSSDSSIQRQNSINSTDLHNQDKPQLVRKLAFRCPHVLSGKKSFVSSMLRETSFPSHDKRTSNRKHMSSSEVSKSCLSNGLKHCPL